MARLSIIARDVKRRKLAEKFKKLRAELKEKGDYDALQKLPRNSSCLLYTSPSPRDRTRSRMPSSA